MIWSAIRAKLRDQGPVGFARSGIELTAAYGVIAVHAAVLFSAAIGLVVVAAPFAAAQWVSEMAEYKER
jgi:hypothetical protein